MAGSLTTTGTQVGAAFVPSTYAMTIGGKPVTVAAGSLQITRQINQRDTARFVINDAGALLHFYEGQAIVITDRSGVLVWAGYIVSSLESKPVYRPYRQHSITATDGHYLADKRRVAAAYANQPADAIVKDLITNALTAEGVTWQRGINLYSPNQSNWETDVSGAGYFSYGYVTYTRDTTISYSGKASLKVQMDGSYTYQPAAIFTAGAKFKPSTQYTISAYMKGTGTNLRFYSQGENANGNMDNGGGNGVITLTNTWTRYTFTFTTKSSITSSLAGIRVDTGNSQQAITFWMDQCQIEQGAVASAWEVGGAVLSIVAGPSIVASTFNYATVAQALDALATKCNYWWTIDENKVLWFAPPTARAAPFVLDSKIMDHRRGATVTQNTPLYRNRQFVVGIKALTNTQVETKKGDGTNKVFTMSYPFAQVPTITVNAVDKTKGIKGLDTGKDFYWSKGDPNLVQDSGAAALLTTDTLSVTYVGQFTTVVQSDDTAQQTIRAAMEGGTTGIVEDVISGTAIGSVAEGFETATAALNKFSVQGSQVACTILKPGLVQGQLVTVNLPEFDINGQALLIEKIDINDADPYLTYAITAVKGPFNANWVSYFAALGTAVTSIDNVSAGLSGTLTQTATFSVVRTATFAFTPTVQTTVYPSDTLYPSNSQYPG